MNRWRNAGQRAWRHERGAADAYAITGEQKYLDCARRFSHRMLLVPLENGKDCLDNMHYQYYADSKVIDCTASLVDS